LKLAEALVLRADTRRRIDQLRERLKASALVQEGEKPAEDPAELFAEVRRALDSLTVLIKQINRTNLEAALPDGRTLTDALAERDALTLSFSVLQHVVAAAIPDQYRLARTEIKNVATVNIADLRKEMDDTARRRRELDTMIQAANWAVDLRE